MDLSQAPFRSQTTMESTGPIRPNVITRWTKYQAQEHPEKYDMNDGIVVTDAKPKKAKGSYNLRKRAEQELYSDSIVVESNKTPVSEKKVASDLNKKYYSRVKVELFLESLCPDTHRFVKGPLSKVAHDPYIMDIIDLQMYVFGKGTQTSRDPQQFSCQHGPAECYGNLVENCVIRHTNPGDAIDALVCLHDQRKFDENSISYCCKNLEDPKTIKAAILECIKGEGKHLLQRAYDKTPKLSYVPSMRINKGDVVPASSNLKDIICMTWTGEKPPTCT